MEATVSTHFLRGTEGELNTAGMIYEHREIGVLCLNALQDLTCAFRGERIGMSDDIKLLSTRELD
jgi:hypothetical protein